MSGTFGVRGDAVGQVDGVEARVLRYDGPEQVGLRVAARTRALEGQGRAQLGVRIFHAYHGERIEI